MQDLDNRKTLATKCKGKTAIKKKTVPVQSSLYTVYYHEQHVSFWSQGAAAAATSCVMAAFRFNWRYLTHLPNFHIHVVYKSNHSLGLMNQYFSAGVKSLSSGVAALFKHYAASKVSPSEKSIVSLSKLSQRTV